MITTVRRQHRLQRRPGFAWARAPFLALGLLAMVLGIGAGLARLGWAVPNAMAGQAGWHGPLMLHGVFGALIGLERAVAVQHRWAYLGPLAAGAGTLALLLGKPTWGFGAYACSGAVLVLTTLAAFRRQPEPFMVVLLLGAFLSWLGPTLWALGAMPALNWLPSLGFLVLTIAGERLELSRFVPRGPGAGVQFVGVLMLLLAAMALPDGDQARAFGLGLLGLAAWLARHDLARHTVRTQGLTRYTAVALLSGYAQLALAGGVLLTWGLVPGSAAYDVALHALLLGFVMSMVFGHAPLIGPALLRVRLPFHAVLYLPLLFLHVGVLLRSASPLHGWAPGKAWGGALSAGAIGLFVALLVVLGVSASMAARPAAGQGARP